MADPSEVQRLLRRVADILDARGVPTPPPTSQPRLILPGVQLTGKAREAVAKVLAAEYRTGASIRDLADLSGRSYGWVHRVLTESGVQLRDRGAARRRRKAATRG